MLCVAGEAPEQQTLRVVKAAAYAKGNTASGGAGKQVELENGARIQVPDYINEGEEIVVKCDTATFVKRAG